MKMFKSLLSVTLLFALFSISSSVQAHVLDGSKEWNGHYYKIIAMKMRWDNAKKFCESMGGHLATAETADENEMIKSLVVKYANNKETGYWIGGIRDKNTVWKWVTGKTIVDYFDWLDGPGNLDNIVMLGHKDGKWVSQHVYYDYEFVCEWERYEDAHDSTL